VGFEDDFRRRLDAQGQLFRFLQTQKDLASSVEGSYERLQRSIADSARLAFHLGTERSTAQMAALIRDNERAMRGVAEGIPQLDRDALRATYQIGARMAEIEWALSAIASPIDSVVAFAAKLARQRSGFDAGLSGAFQATKRAMESIAGLDRIWRQNPAISDVYAHLMRSSALEHLPALRAAAIAIQLPQFDTTFLGSLHKRLEQLHESGAAVEAAMAEVDSAIKERAGCLPQSRVNFKGMFDLLYPLLLVLLQLWYARFSQERSSAEMQRFVESQLRATETHLALQIQTLSPPESREPFRVVERRCYLRADRFAKAMTVGVLYPNQLVEVHRTSGQWAYIEFFDYVNAIPKTGWILKKYVTTIGLKPERVERPPTGPTR